MSETALLPMMVCLGFGTIGLLTSVYEMRPTPSTWYQQKNDGAYKKEIVLVEASESETEYWVSSGYPGSSCIHWRTDAMTDLQVDRWVVGTGFIRLSDQIAQFGAAPPKKYSPLRFSSKTGRQFYLEIKAGGRKSPLCRSL